MISRLTSTFRPKSSPGWLSFIADVPARLRRVTRLGAYQPELDGLRFVAIAMVVLAHMFERAVRAVELSRPLTALDRQIAYMMPPASTGVALFFAISGYILAAGYQRQVEKKLVFRLSTYFERRASRLMPPYVLVLLATYLLLSLTSFRPEMTQIKEVPSSLTVSFLSSLFYLHGPLFASFPRNFPPGWSLELEVQFYVVAPFLFALYCREPDRGKRCWIGAIALAASLGIFWIYQIELSQNHRFYFTLLHWFQFFWVGVWLTDFMATLKTVKGLTPRFWDYAGILGFAMLMLTGIASYSVSQPAEAVGLEALKLVSVVLLFGGALLGRTFRQFCSSGWISLLGGACYSYYLTHLQIIQVITPVIASRLRPSSIVESYGWELLLSLPFVLVGGLVFYIVVERPCMELAWPRHVRLNAIRWSARLLRSIGLNRSQRPRLEPVAAESKLKVP